MRDRLLVVNQYLVYGFLLPLDLKNFEFRIFDHLLLLVCILDHESV